MPSVLSYAEDINISDLLNSTNNMRTERGLSALKLNGQLSRAAEAKAQDMLEKDYWAHESPDGKEPWDFIVGAGYDYLYAGENLAVDFNESQNVVEAWYESPSHRANLLNDKYTEIGFAVVDGELEGRKTTLVVQMFGYPRTRAAAISSDSTGGEVLPVENTIEVVETALEAEVVEVMPDSNGLSAPVIVENRPLTGSVLNTADVFNASRYIALLLGFFLTVMFAIDGYYVRKMGIFRVSGHTILHVLMLIAAIVGIWYTQIGLVL